MKMPVNSTTEIIFVSIVMFQAVFTHENHMIHASLTCAYFLFLCGRSFLSLLLSFYFFQEVPTILYNVHLGKEVISKIKYEDV